MKKLHGSLLLALCLLASISAFAHNYGYTTVILNAATSAPTQGVINTAPTSNISRDSYALSCTTTGSGAVGATLGLYGYNNQNDTPIDIATLYTSGTNKDTVAIAGNVPWKYITVVQTAIAGTAAATTCTLSY